MTTLMTIIGATLGFIYLVWIVVDEHKKASAPADKNRQEPNSETIEAMDAARHSELTTIGILEELFVDLNSEEEDSYWVERARLAEESGWASEEESISLLKERQAEEVEKRSRRDQFFTELDDSVKRHQEELAKNPELRKEEEKEQRLWDNTLMDGLEDE